MLIEVGAPGFGSEEGRVAPPRMPGCPAPIVTSLTPPVSSGATWTDSSPNRELFRNCSSDLLPISPRTSLFLRTAPATEVHWQIAVKVHRHPPEYKDTYRLVRF
jgi:hypothetical protein